MQGVLKRYMDQLYYVFDLSIHEASLPTKRDPETGKRSRQTRVLAEELQKSFGMPVQEHDESQGIDLEKGFEGMNEKEENKE